MDVVDVVVVVVSQSKMTNFFFRLFSFEGIQNSPLFPSHEEGAFFNGFKKKKKRPTERI